MSDRRRINLSVSPELYDELEKRAGPNVTLSSYVTALVERAIRMEREPELGLRRPQQVAIDPEPLMHPLREIDARIAELEERVTEVQRAVHQYGHFLMLRAPAEKHQKAIYDAREAAARELMQWARRNGEDIG